MGWRGGCGRSSGELIGALRYVLSGGAPLAVETLREAEITADGIDLDGADLGRNTLTWTYMVHDNPFATKGMANMFGMI